MIKTIELSSSVHLWQGQKRELNFHPKNSLDRNTKLDHSDEFKLQQQIRTRDLKDLYRFEFKHLCDYSKDIHETRIQN